MSACLTAAVNLLRSRNEYCARGSIASVAANLLQVE
jgi:hypothetical protein